MGWNQHNVLIQKPPSHEGKHLMVFLILNGITNVDSFTYECKKYGESATSQPPKLEAKFVTRTLPSSRCGWL